MRRGNNGALHSMPQRTAKINAEVFRVQRVRGRYHRQTKAPAALAGVFNDNQRRSESHVCVIHLILHSIVAWRRAGGRHFLGEMACVREGRLFVTHVAVGQKRWSMGVKGTQPYQKRLGLETKFLLFIGKDVGVRPLKAAQASVGCVC